EWEEGHLPGALHISKSYLEQRIEAAVPDRDAPVVLYCAGGIRSLFAAQTLSEMGYTDVVSMIGGFQAWKSEGRPWRTPVVLSQQQKQRYSRHLLIPEVGIEGQARLLDSKVLLIGAGGLGSPAMLYLAAAGVGTLGIVDFDTVDLSNLQRQIVHTTERVGRRKTESAAETIRALNPDVTVVPHEEMLTDENVERLIAGYDVILDGTDTFETRYTLNDAAVRAGIPVVHASVFRFEGQLSVFRPFDGPCYRCLYPTPPPPELAPGCSVAGVLGVVPGVMGMLQATEAIKLLLGIGDSLAGRLLIYDALDGTFQEVRLRRDPACPTCGEAVLAARVSA
nr:molybdopterin-synthase adenylyltransferase MoeB [Chloroflexota bacterium]